MPLVRATKRGFDGGQIREPDDEFVWDGPTGSWMELLETAEPVAPAGVTVEQVIEATKTLLETATDEQKTPTGLIKKTVLEQHLGQEVSQGTFLEAMKQLKQSAAA